MDLPNQIETKRLILRLINQDDFDIFSDIVKDDDVSNNLEFVLKNKPEKSIKSLFQTIITSFSSKDPIIALIVITKEDGNRIGSCGLIPLECGNEAECFYALLPEYRGSGFAIEAMKKLIEYGFSKLNLFKIIAHLNPNKSPLWKVAERVGMKYMGHKQINAISSKAMYYSIEKNEFEAQRIY